MRIPSRKKLVVASVIVAVAVTTVGAATAVGVHRLDDARTICAEFTDAIGLYEGNNVALLGMNIGTVTSIVNKPDHVEVDFTVPSKLDLPEDVGAVTFAASIVTDRHVELTKPYTGGPKFTGDRCIELQETKTPIGISETFVAVTTLANSILGSDATTGAAGNSGATAIADTLHSVNQSLRGSGPQLNKALRQLATVIGDPYGKDTTIRSLIDNLEILTSSFVENWQDFASVLGALTGVASLLSDLSDQFSGALEKVVDLLPVVVENLRRYQARVFAAVDPAIPVVHEALTHSGVLLDILGKLPALTGGLAALYDPALGAGRVTYSPPRVAVLPDLGQADPVTAGIMNLILGIGVSK